MKLTVKTLVAATLSFAFAGPSLAQGGAPFTIAESGEVFNRLSDAVQAIGESSATIMIAPGTYGDCAVQTAGSITYRSEIAGRAIFDAGTCEGKATLVLRGHSAIVDGIIFQNMRVPDANGAGIRIEKGDLLVTNALFRNSEQGILSANDPSSSITIDRSTFQRLGRCDRGLSCAHSIYIGNYGSLTVTNSRFEKGNGGHYVKSRSPRATITNNSF
ncbi:FIG00635939: hypothetical protein, partial [hydrothermal vent metagenome]